MIWICQSFKYIWSYFRCMYGVCMLQYKVKTIHYKFKKITWNGENIEAHYISKEMLFSMDLGDYILHNVPKKSHNSIFSINYINIIAVKPRD